MPQTHALRSHRPWTQRTQVVARGLSGLLALCFSSAALHADDPLTVPDAAVVLAEVEPARLLADPEWYLLPIEPLQAWCETRFGFDPHDLQYVRYVGWSRERTTLQAGWLLHFSRPAPLNALVEHLCPGARAESHQTFEVWSDPTANNETQLAICLIDRHTLLVAPRSRLTAWLTQVKTADGDADPARFRMPSGMVFRSRISTSDSLLMLHLARSFLEADPDAAATFHRFADTITEVEMQVRLPQKLQVTLVFTADEGEAARAEELFETLLSQTERRLQRLWDLRRAAQDPVSQGIADYLDRLTGRMLDATRPVRRDNVMEVQWFIEPSMLFPAAFALISQPAVSHPPHRGRLSAQRLKRLGLAMHTVLAERDRFPGAYNTDARGTPLLSWRVHLLKHLEKPERELYEAFHLNEPWDSPHNKSLISRMPDVYRSSQPANEHTTRFLVPFGPDAMFTGEKGRRPAEVTDGFSNTLLIVEVNRPNAVIWTRPEDLDVTQPNPLERLVEPGQLVFRALLADGAQRDFSVRLDKEQLSALWTITGGEPTPTTSPVSK